jgi:hypothetical protein
MRRQQPGRSVLKQTTSESLELCRDWPVDVGVGDMGVGDILCGCPRVSAGVRGCPREGRPSGGRGAVVVVALG